MNYPNLQLWYSNAWNNLSDIEIRSMTQTEINQKPATLEISYDLNSGLNFEKGDRIAVGVQISEDDTDGTLLFTGKVSDKSTSSNQTVSIQVSNLIDDLERLTFETSTILGSDKYSPSHLTLFRDENADPITIGEQIKQALDYAISQGILVSYNQEELDALDIYMPAAEAIDLTIAEVIKKSLAYRPDIITAVQYSGNPGDPQLLRFAPRDLLESETISATESKIPLNIKARYDLQIDGVVLYYYWLDKDADGVETYRNQTDTSGITSGPNILKQTIPMLGTQLENSSEISLINFPDTSKTSYTWYYDDSLASFQWYFWRDMAVELGYTGLPESMTIDNTSPIQPEVKNIVISEQKTSVNYIVLPSRNPGFWAMKALSGRPFYGSCDLCVDIGTLGKNSTYVPIVIPETAGFFVIDSDANPVSINIFSTPDEIPEDLASQLFSILNPLQYDGTIIHPDDLKTPSGICSILRKLNIADLSDDLTTMNALIQSCAMDYFSGIKTRKFGPADHLEPKDFIALSRTNRSRNFSLIFPYA